MFSIEDVDVDGSAFYTILLFYGSGA